MSNNNQCNNQFKQQESCHYYDPRQDNEHCRETNSYSGVSKSGYYHSDDFSNCNSYSRNENRDHNSSDYVLPSDKFGDMTIYELSNNNTFMVIGYLLCWPLCLYLMWKYSNWTKTVKIVVTVVCGLFGLGILIKLIGTIGLFSLFL